VQSRYVASARPGAQDAFRALVPQPSTEAGAMVCGFPAKALETISHQTLVLHGRDDRVVPPDCGLLIHRSVSNSQLHMFGQCGHWVQAEREDEFLTLVGNFLN
jgi:2-hydroxy-6-oxo-octa-2,4-dienoate hydrolase